MNNNLVDSSELEALNSIKIRIKNFIGRKFIKLYKILKLYDFYFLIKNIFSVKFWEENLELKLPYGGNFKRSVNLFDQREVLHRALIACAFKNGIIDENKSVIDAGAQNGDCALAWSKLIKGSVYAVDPSLPNLKYIDKVAKKNYIYNIKTFNCAIGENEGYLYPLHNVDHTPFSDSPSTKYSIKNKVKSLPLDKLYENEKFGSIGFIHLDVEGMELYALRGAKKIILKHSPVITFEAHITIDDLNSIFSIFRQAHYSIYMINEATPGGRPDCINFLALPKSTQLDLQVSTLNAVKPNQAFFKTTVGENLVPIV